LLRLLEHYTSTQGEGPYVGVLTQFVRFAGCNLKCSGWPCDTPYAIKPELFKDEQKKILAEELAFDINRKYIDTFASNICFTGGEPLIQPTQDIVRVIQELDAYDSPFTFEMFTNGTRPLPDELIDLGCRFIMDWKLPASNENPYDETRIQNIPKLTPGDAVKFVIAKRSDLTAAKELYWKYLVDQMPEVYVGAAWGQYPSNAIVQFIQEHRLPWRLNVQVHNYIYGAQVRGI
jgi:7-carboxy-7-deazaguanine synthase